MYGFEPSYRSHRVVVKPGTEKYETGNEKWVEMNSFAAEHFSFVIEGVAEHRFFHNFGGRSSSDCCIRVFCNSIAKKNCKLPGKTVLT